MKNDFLPAWFQNVLLGVLAAMLVAMPAHAFISTWGGTAIGPLWLWKSWKEILLALLIVPIVVWLSLKPGRWAVLGRDKLFWLIIGFIALLLGLTAYYWDENGATAAMAGLAMDSRYLLIFGVVYVLFRFGRFTWKRIRRTVALFLIGAGTVIALIGLLQAWVLPADFLSSFGYDKHSTIAPYVLIDENPDALRAFATLRGPNDFGAFLILPLLLSLLFARRNKWFLVSAGTMLVGLFMSGSRSAWIGALVAASILATTLFSKRILWSQKTIGIALAGIAALVIIGLAAVSVPAVRLAVFHSSPGDSSLTEGSTDQHWVATANGIGRIADQPLGCGAGCAGPASYYSSSPEISENYYVQIAEETGVIGLALWAGIAALVVRRLWLHRDDWLAHVLFASFMGLSVIGLWLHVWNDDPLSLTWWVLAGAVLGYHASVSGKKTVS